MKYYSSKGLAKDKINMYKWHLVEHTGTHMDAPIHFSATGHTVDQIPVETLVAPLAVIDIRDRATEACPDGIAAELLLCRLSASPSFSPPPSPSSTFSVSSFCIRGISNSSRGAGKSTVSPGAPPR